MKIKIENLDGLKTTKEMIMDLLDENIEYAFDVGEIINALAEKGVEVARSSVYAYLNIAYSNDQVGRKQVGNKFFYYKVK